jgi:hypothetical protein
MEVSRVRAIHCWETKHEEFEFSDGGIHCNLARVLRIRFVGGPPHGESEGRHSPPEAERQVSHLVSGTIAMSATAGKTTNAQLKQVVTGTGVALHTYLVSEPSSTIWSGSQRRSIVGMVFRNTTGGTFDFVDGIVRTFPISTHQRLVLAGVRTEYLDVH